MMKRMMFDNRMCLAEKHNSMQQFKRNESF